MDDEKKWMESSQDDTPSFEDSAANPEHPDAASDMDLSHKATKSEESQVPPRYGYYRVHGGGTKNEQSGSSPKTHHKPLSGFVNRKLFSVIAYAIVFGLVAALTFEGATSAMQSLGTTAEPKTDSPDEIVTNLDNAQSKDTTDSDIPSASDTTSAGTVAEVAKAAMPSVVAITTVSIQEIQDWFGGTHQYASSGSGSGIIVGENDNELLIATNNHVVSGATDLSVFFYGSDVAMASSVDAIDENDAVSGTIKGTDANLDLAVLSVKKEDISKETMEQIKIADIGNSDTLVVGEQVVAIGNALGYGQSVTSGWVSALNRSLTMSDGTVSNLIQTDAAINPGNSGGALLNMEGKLIGINSAKYADQAVEGMGYAIPISKASPILKELMNRTVREKQDAAQSAYLGVSLADLSQQAKLMYNMPSGAFVVEVQSGGAAEEYGIKKSDIIVEMDGTSITGSEQLLDLLQYYQAGETVDIVIARANNGQYMEQTISVTLGSQPSQNG